MQEPYKEGVATHLGPESCAGGRKASGEALTGAHAGRAIELRNQQSDAPTPSMQGEGNTLVRESRECPDGVPESKNPSMRGSSMHENRETPKVPSADGGEGRPEKASGHTSERVRLRGVGRSDSTAEAGEQSPGPSRGVGAAESVEGSRSTKGNADQTAASRTLRRADASNGLERVREVARRDKDVRFTALLHHVTPDLLEVSYNKLNPKAAPGVDGVTWQMYGQDLAGRLARLHENVHRGTYRAKPSKRAWIPKPDGGQRPLGIAGLEDKIVQQAVRTVLEQIYEEDFLGFSYGYRPGRSQHDALDALWVGLKQRKVSWVLDADIRGFFDTISHEWMMKFLEHRIADRRVLRLVRKWLRAGVSDDGEWSKTTVGTPQGATVSPLLANVYLHYVFDLWADLWRRKLAQGDVIVVRYADDIVMGFQYRSDAERCLRELQERLAQFKLELNREKTRLLEFGRFAAQSRRRRGQGKPDTFDFLGFMHYCGKTRKGWYTIKRKPAPGRVRRTLLRIQEELRRRRHWPVIEQGAWLHRVLGGWLQYYAVPGTSHSLSRFRTEVTWLWMRQLRRRSQKGRSLTWRRMATLADRWLPPARILHPYPDARFFVTHPR